MSLRAKLVLALVACTTVAAMAVGLLSYLQTARRLTAEVDASLELVANRAESGRGPGGPGGEGPDERSTRQLRGAADTDLQVIDGAGDRSGGTYGTQLPIEAADRRVAAAQATGVQVIRTTVHDGGRIRMLTRSLGGAAGALQVARSLGENQRVLAGLRTRLLLVTLVVVGLSGVAGWLIARQITGRLTRVTTAAEHVAATGQLDVAVPVGGSDEAARLGGAFNEMLGALASSKADQQRLVQDAGHELRTPMTSLRTNVYALRSFESLDREQRARVLDDLESETEELTRLINEVVEVATDRRGDEPVLEVDLEQLAGRVVARARSRSERDVVLHSRSVVVAGRPAALQRAMANLVENALKFDRSGRPVEMWVQSGPGLQATVQVADHGPGFSEADLPHVFDRFFRSMDARSEPGSGLGLSIVAEVVAAHGGTVGAANRPEGGAVVGFTLPLAPPGPVAPTPD